MGTPQQVSKPRVARRDLALASLVLVFWLIPISYQAVMAKGPRWFGRHAQEVYQISALFTHRHDGVARWEDLDESEYFPHRPFGFRNRFDRFMMRYAGTKDRRARRRRKYLAAWVVERDRQLHPQEPPIVQVRYYFVTHELAKGPLPEGHWVKRPLMSFHPRERHTLEIHRP
jgi:hypothetical protein